MRRLRTAIAACLAASVLITLPAQGSPAGDEVVIGEVYLNGGSSGATYRNKFVELVNPTDAEIDVSGWSVQYRSASSTGTFTGVIPLGEHHLEPGSRLLISGNANAANGAELPTPDVTSNVAFSGSAGGTLALARTTTPLTGDRSAVLATSALVDLVGYGTSTTYEGSAPQADGYSVSSALTRAGAVDTDDNADDFSGAAPTPEACGEACGGGVVTPPTTVTIAEVQGAGDTSPLAGRTVTTRGVVTAAYPSGGLDGVYLQTAGTGGDVDLASHRASDAVFVYSASLASQVRVGDHVEVTGQVSEYRGLTEISPPSGSWRVLGEPTEAVKPAAIDFPLADPARESLEGMLLRPGGNYTITNNYATNQYAEIGLAAGRTPLPQPTNVARPGSAQYDAVLAENARRLVTLDDGASLNFLAGDNREVPLPWLRPDNEVRVGAPASFTAPVVLDYRNDLWKLQPTTRLTAGEPEPVSIGSTRTAAPDDVGGAVQIATFNVLNYFTTLGEDYAASGAGSCTYFADRDGVNITVNRCANDGPRGAANAASLKRQQDKIVAAIDRLGADVVSLEEIENSAAFGIDRDTALRHLVDALNASGGGWEYVESPTRVPEVEDVIRTGFIYRPDAVRPVKESTILDDPAFDNAREPLAQEFRPRGAGSKDDFVVIVNHFKSKGSGTGDDADQGDGQGASNASRVRQARALVDFAAARAAAARTDAVFLTGDFNAYNEEDPVEVIEDAGYVNVTRERTDKETYQFGGLVGSLDHVFASPRANAQVTGADVWNINAFESVGREYSRYNTNVTRLYAADPFRASDHDPEIVGFDLRGR